MRRIILLFLFAFVQFASNARADTFIYFNSQPGDYIGGGVQRIYTSPGGTITTSRVSGGVEVVYRDSTDWWYLDFVPPASSQLSAGSYEQATRYPFQSPTKPGLSIDGNGRGCNQSTGYFVVREAVYDSSGNVLTLAIDFEQHCEGGVPALLGVVRINSSIPLAAPDPVASAGANRKVEEGTLVTLDGSNSRDADGSIVSYLWTQVGGPTVPLNNAASPQANFVAPEVRPGGADLLFRLKITDTSSLTSEATVSIHVASKSDPKTYIYFNSAGGDYIGGGVTQTLTTDDGFITSSAFSGGVGIHFSGSTWWDLTFVPPSGSSLQKTEYVNAIRAPFQGPSAPGLEISGDGRGCDTLTGRFTVLDFESSSTAAVTSFAADFEQHCEGFMPALLGSVRYNYVNPSVPKANAGAAFRTVPDQQVTLDGSASTDSDGSIIAYEWRQLSGPTVNLVNANTARPSFVAPHQPATGFVVTFELMVTDNDRYKNLSTTAVTVGPGQPPIVSGGSLPNGTVGMLYQYSVPTGGTLPLVVAIGSGTLPPGLTLNANGEIAGSPTAAGTFAGTLVASNGIMPDASQPFSIVIAAGVSRTLLSSSVASPSTGQALTLTAVVSGANPGGSVTFTDNGIAIGTVSLNGGSATLALASLTVGNHSIVVNYGGDSNNQPSQSAATSLSVSPSVASSSASGGGGGGGGCAIGGSRSLDPTLLGLMVFAFVGIVRRRSNRCR